MQTPDQEEIEDRPREVLQPMIHQDILSTTSKCWSYFLKILLRASKTLKVVHSDVNFTDHDRHPEL
jgi:hypothetical protein